MKILLDTHCWLWWIAEPHRLGANARHIMADSGNELFLSAASCWEISIKYGLGKLNLPDVPELFVPPRLQRDGIAPLPITLAHTLHAWALPRHHRDPFDRMLIVQVQAEGLILLTADTAFAPYGVATIAASV